LPLITTRRASTTIQLYDGQSFAIGGLIKNNLVTSMKGLPVLGELPILGALFRSTDYQQDRTELVFVITAHMVKPLPPNYTLPTDSSVAPTRAQLMLGGRLEGRAPAAAATSTATLSPAAARGFELK
jgi:pilus assembly protein CpaC